MVTKLIETRLMIKREDDWTFANYEWNDTQTEVRKLYHLGEMATEKPLKEVFLARKS
jgi:hypothetical protein